MTLAAQSSRTLAFRLLSTALSFAASVFLARGLGASGRGEYALLMLIVTWSALVLSLGYTESASTVVARKQLAEGETLALGGAIAVVSISAAAALLLIAHLEHWSFLDGVLLKYPAYLLAGIALVTVRGITNATLLGLGRIQQMNVANALAVSYPLLMAVLCALRMLTIGTAVVAALITSLLASVYALRALQLRAASTMSGKLPAVGRTMLPIFGQYLVGGANQRIDLLVVGLYLPTRDAGIYALALSIVELLYIVPTAMGTVILHVFGPGDPPRAAAVLASSLRKTVLLNSLFSLGMLGTLWFVIPLVFGKQFAGAYGVVSLLLLGYLPYSLLIITTGFLNVVGRGAANLVVAAFAAATGLALLLLWVPRWGMHGAAGATAVSYAAGAVAAILYTSRVSGVKARDLIGVRRADFLEVRQLAGDIARQI